MDAGALISQVLTSLIVPGGIGALVLARQQRQKLAAEAKAQNAAADETDAKAEVLLSGEALKLFQEARTDAKEARAEAGEARKEAREARKEALACQRTTVQVWAALDEFDRHARRLEGAILDLGGAVPPRPPGLQPQLNHE